MQTATPSARPQAGSKRQRAIAPYLEKLEAIYARWAGGAGREERLEIRLYKSLLSLDAWEADQLQVYYESAVTPEAGCPALVAHGIALLLKSAADIDSLMSMAGSSETKLYALQAELMLDTAIGMALLREAQKAQNDLVKAGDLALAKKLSRFQHKLRNAIADVKKLISESERDRADQITDQLTDAPRQESIALDKLSMHAAATKAAQDYERLKLQQNLKHKARAALTALPSRTDLLFYALLLALAVWLAVFKLPQMSRMGPPLLGLADLPGGGVFVSADAKPPSLYVGVDAAAWEAIPAEARLTIVETVGDVLEANGYSGALLRTDRNRPLAEWLEDRGAFLIESTEAAPPAGRDGDPDGIFVP